MPPWDEFLRALTCSVQVWVETWPPTFASTLKETSFDSASVVGGAKVTVAVPFLSSLKVA